MGVLQGTHRKLGAPQSSPGATYPQKGLLFRIKIEPEKSETHIYKTEEKRIWDPGLKKRQDMTGIMENLLTTPQLTVPSSGLLLEHLKLIQAYPRQSGQNYSL